MNRYELVLETRRRLDDFGGDTAQLLWETDDSGCLWKNAEIARALDEAEREFCRRVPQRVSGVQVARADMDLRLRNGWAEYPLDERTLTVEQVLLKSTGRALRRVTLSELAACPSLRTQTTVEAYLLGESALTLTVFGLPREADGLIISGTLLPEAPEPWTTATAAKTLEPMIRESRHMDLIDWAERLLYLKRDADTYQPGASDRAAARFAQQVGAPVDAWLEEHRLRTPKRLVTMGYFY